MVNHPNRSRKKAIVTQLKELIRSASDEQIIDLAAGRTAVAVFPKAPEVVQINSYFASDYPDGAGEEYWQTFGPRETLMLAIDDGLYELFGSLEWQDDLAFAVEDTPLATHWPVLKELLDRGLASKAESVRRKLLASNLEEVVEHALEVIRAGEV